MKSDGQLLYEAGLLAIIDTAKNAFLEGYYKACDQSCCISGVHAEQFWKDSETYAACVKALEQYGVKL